MPKLSELFDIRYGHSLELNRLKRADPHTGIAFVSRQMGDNGVSAYVEPVKGEAPAAAGEMSVALGGNGVLSTFLQDRPFYTGRDVSILTSRADMSRGALLYYCMCIKANRYRHSYGRQANRTLKDLQVPSLQELPEWVEPTAALNFAGRDSPSLAVAVPELNTLAWKPFKLSDLFEIFRGEGISKLDRAGGGSTPYVGALTGNNGVAGFVDRPAKHPGGTITLNWNGIGGVGYAFYQPNPYWCSGDVSALYPRFPMTPAVAHFIITVIRKERYRFSFGRKLTGDRMADLEIRLPCLPDGSPAWQFMECYIKALPFSSQI